MCNWRKVKVEAGIFIGSSERTNTVIKEKATRSEGKEFGV